MLGEFERDDASVKEWRLRILFLGLVDDIRRLGIAFAVVVVVIVVVVFEDEDTSSGSAEDEVSGGGGEVAGVFDVSSVSFSVQILRDTAQRCICRLDRIVTAVLLLLFADVDRKLSADGVRFVYVFFC
jgi:hypothetical protein